MPFKCHSLYWLSAEIRPQSILLPTRSEILLVIVVLVAVALVVVVVLVVVVAVVVIVVTAGENPRTSSACIGY